REMLVAALREYGARVRAASSMADALHALCTAKLLPHVLVSDVGMPESDGYELIRRVRASSVAGIRSLPAIAVTAYASPEDRIRALVAGYQAHLAKPIDPALVAATIATLAAARSHAGR